MFGLLGDEDGLGDMGALTKEQRAAVKTLKQQYKKGKQVLAGKKVTVNFKTAQQMNYSEGWANYLVPITVQQKGSAKKPKVTGYFTAPYDGFYTNMIVVSGGAAYAVVISLVSATPTPPSPYPTPTPSTCPTGYIQNPFTGQCQPSSTCPPGQTANPYTGACVPNQRVCPTGYSFDANYNQCMPVSQFCQYGIDPATGMCATYPVTPTPQPQFTYYSQGQQVPVSVYSGNVIKAQQSGFQYVQVTLNFTMDSGYGIFTAPYNLYTTGRVLYQDNRYYAEVYQVAQPQLPNYMYQMQTYPQGSYYAPPAEPMPYQYATPQYANQYAATPQYAGTYGGQTVFDDSGALAVEAAGGSDEMGLPADYVQYDGGMPSMPTIDQAGGGVAPIDQTVSEEVMS